MGKPGWAGSCAGTAPMGVDDLLNGATPGLEATMEGAFVPLSYTPGTPPNARSKAFHSRCQAASLQNWRR